MKPRSAASFLLILHTGYNWPNSKITIRYSYGGNSWNCYDDYHRSWHGLMSLIYVSAPNWMTWCHILITMLHDSESRFDGVYWYNFIIVLFLGNIQNVVVIWCKNISFVSFSKWRVWHSSASFFITLHQSSYGMGTFIVKI